MLLTTWFIVQLGCLSAATAASRWNAAVATFVYVDMFDLESGATVEFVTENLSGGADPVLHLFRVLPDGSHQQVAVADDLSWPTDPNAYIHYTNTGAASSFVLVLRAYGAQSTGTCDVRMNGTLRQNAAAVGGWLAPSSAFVFSPGDRLRTVHLPGGSVMELVLGLQDPYLPTSLAIANSIAGAVEFSVAGTETLFLFGSPQVRNGQNYHTFRGGFVWAAFNDPADADGDGLGDDLELAIGTCGTSANCCAAGDPPQTCAQGYGGKDSDRDGLPDGEEVLGVAGILPAGDDELDLARWGADPRRKDIFLEIDHSTLFGSTNVPEGASPFQWLRDNPHGPGFADYAELEDFATVGRAPFLAGPAAHVRNRDGSAGIAVHMDLGVQPLVAADEHKFGAYSTGTPHGLVPDMVVRIQGPGVGWVSLTINGTTWGFDATGLSAEEIGTTIALSTLFVPEFAAAVEYVGPMAVTNPQDVRVRLASTTPGVHFTRGASPAPIVTLVPMVYHEAFQHAFEPSQFDAVRRGRFHYAVATHDGVGGQADSTGPRFAAGMNKRDFFHEFGHSIGLAHWGHDAWGQEGIDCMPHYRSLMNYDQLTYAFLALDDPLQINPGVVNEIATFGPAWTGNYADFLNWPYAYVFPTGSSGVDWNRDGSLAADPVRAAVMTVDSTNCQSYSQGRTIIDPAPAIAGPVDLVRFGTHLYAIWSDGSTLRAKNAPLGAPGAKSCTGPAGITPGTCLSWSGAFSLATMPNGARGATALTHGGTLFVASADSFGVLTIHRYVAGGLSPLMFLDTQLYLPDAAGMRAQGTPELVLRHHPVNGPTLVLLYHGRDHTYRSFAWNGATWDDEGALVDAGTGTPIAAPPNGDGPAAKSWPDPTLQPAWAPSEYRTLALLTPPNMVPRLYVYTGVDNRWLDVDAKLTVPLVVGKPYMEFRPVRAESGLPDAQFSGHFLVGWQGRCAGNAVCPWVEATALVWRTNPPDVGGMDRLAERDWMQNVWAVVQVGTGAALFSEANLDNVFGLVPSAVGGQTGLTFYPHADGSPMHTYSAYSDFKVMEDYVCLSVGGQQSPVNPCGVTAANPLNVFN